jgi:membrane-associated two-gene conflict system component 1 (EACC1)
MQGEIGSAAPAGESVRVMIKPASDYFAAEDPRAQSEVSELRTALERNFPDALEVGPAVGEKGILADLILSLTSNGAVAALAGVLKAWMAARPAHRELDLEIMDGNGQSIKSLHLNASNIDSESLAKITSAFVPDG